MTYLAVYLYFIGAWALSDCDFLDENGNRPKETYKAIFCIGWPIFVPIWVLRSRYFGE